MVIVYIVDDKLGGIASLINNLINNYNGSGEQKIIVVDKKESTYSKIPYQFTAEQIVLEISILENAYSVIRKLHQLLPDQAGAIVLNDSLEMQMLDHFPTKLTSYQIVHDEYNYSLALKYPNVVDVFIAHSRLYYEELKKSLPDRIGTIFYLPHGVTVPLISRSPQKKIDVIHLLFLGRMSHAKGIFDLPEIAKWLRTWNIPYFFTCIGNGPDLEELKRVWKHDTEVTFLSPKTTEEIVEICAENDVFVFPTQFEGTPVSLLETMSVGLVPVVTDLPGGITEIVTNDIGFRIPQGNTQLFAMAIKELFHNPELLNRLSSASREKVKSEFDVKNTAMAYHKLFEDHLLYFKDRKREKRKLGFRLDHPLIPNDITKLARTLLKL